MLACPGVNAPGTGTNQYALEVWERAEGGGAGCDGQAQYVETWRYCGGPAANPLNTTQNEAGDTDRNYVDVKLYYDYYGTKCRRWGIRVNRTKRNCDLN